MSIAIEPIQSPVPRSTVHTIVRTAKKSARRRTSNVSHRRIGGVWAFLDTGKIRIYMIVSVVVLGLVYLWLVNSSAAAGFRLSDLEGRVDTLNSDYRRLELVRTELQSLTHIQARGEEMNMVASGRVEYIHGDTVVAVVDSE